MNCDLTFRRNALNDEVLTGKSNPPSIVLQGARHMWAQ